MDLAIDYLRRGEVEARPEGPVQQLQERLSTLMCAPSRSILSQRSAKALEPAFYKSSARAYLRNYATCCLHEENGTLHVTQGASRSLVHRRTALRRGSDGDPISAPSPLKSDRPSCAQRSRSVAIPKPHARQAAFFNRPSPAPSPGSNRRDRFARSTTFNLPIPRDDNVIVVPPRLTSCIQGGIRRSSAPIEPGAQQSLTRLCNHITIWLSNLITKEDTVRQKIVTPWLSLKPEPAGRCGFSPSGLDRRCPWWKAKWVALPSSGG